MAHINNIFNIKINNISSNGSVNFGNTIHKGHSANAKSVGGQTVIGDASFPSMVGLEDLMVLTVMVDSVDHLVLMDMVDLADHMVPMVMARMDIPEDSFNRKLSGCKSNNELIFKSTLQANFL